MSKKPSLFVTKAAATLFQELQSKYQLPENAAPEIELLLYKIIVDYTCQFMTSSKENVEITEYEMLLLRHKNKQAFIAALQSRTGCAELQAERVYDKLRQKLPGK
jgi:hypothetical protein